jgi:hypothetical protein
MNGDGLRTLLGELELDASRLDALEAKYHLVKKKLARIEPDEFDYIALAHMIGNLYSCMENYFTRIAKHFENRIDPTTWHRDLLNRMMIRVPDIRPAVLTDQQAREIDQLRSFRHVLRHIYLDDIDTRRLLLVDSRVPAAIGAFRAADQTFRDTLDQLIRSLGSESTD